mmetsp:Transcript_9060/g.19586  ORF Transcript_9060/g.19586 Transcript_9060/m.19586 type:complete len:84 (+) Transcript_9060:547-798(+)
MMGKHNLASDPADANQPSSAPWGRLPTILENSPITAVWPIGYPTEYMRKIAVQNFQDGLMTSFSKKPKLKTPKHMIPMPPQMS